MAGPLDATQSCQYWQQDKWTGQFAVRWHLIKDVPNGNFREIRLANNENKPVTNSRDTQEVRVGGWDGGYRIWNGRRKKMAES